MKRTRSGMQRRRTAPHDSARSGITLLEVLLATAIFLAALTAILQIMNVGHDSRLSARLDAEAALRCESLMGEYVSGMSPLVAESKTPFADDTNEEWVYSTVIEDGGGESLLLITVIVEHLVNGEQVNSYFELSRLMRDPQLFLDAALSAAETEDEE